MAEPASLPAGIDGSALPGPFGVGHYAAKLREYLRERSRVQLFGEVWNLRLSRAKVYFELRDVDGALPCSMWRTDFDALRLGEGALADGSQVVVGGGLDYYVGSRTSSPSFSFAVAELRVAGEGDLLAQLDRLRKALDAEGLFEPQKLLARPALPRTIGVVTGEGGKARDDVLAGLRRRGWAGRLVWAFAPVQDRHAAPRDHGRAAGSRGDRRGRRHRRRARRRLAGGPVLLLRRDAVPHGRAARRAGDRVGRPPHRPHADRRRRRAELLDADARRRVRRARALRPGRAEIARGSASRPRCRVRTAARGACWRPAGELVGRVRAAPGRPRPPRAAAPRAGAGAAVARARRARRPRARAPAPGPARGARLGPAPRSPTSARGSRGARSCSTARRARPRVDANRAAGLQALALALAAHDPARTLERGYALVTDRAGEPVTSAAAARAAGDVVAALRRRRGRRDDRRRASERCPERSPSPTSRRPRAWRRSSSAWTPARPACARRSSCAARAARSSSCAPPSSKPSARASRSCASTSSSRAWRRAGPAVGAPRAAPAAARGARTSVESCYAPPSSRPPPTPPPVRPRPARRVGDRRERVLDGLGQRDCLLVGWMLLVDHGASCRAGTAQRTRARAALSRRALRAAPRRPAAACRRRRRSRRRSARPAGAGPVVEVERGARAACPRRGRARIQRLRGALLVAREAAAERDDAAGLGQPDVARHGIEQRAQAAAAEAVGVGVVVQAPDRRLAVEAAAVAREVARHPRLVEQVAGQHRAAVALRLDDVVVVGRARGVDRAVGWLTWLISFHGA